LISDCSQVLSPAAIVGVALGAGAVAGIIIAAVVCAGIAAFGAKKGYDVWKNKRSDLSGANTNPMYRDDHLKGTNPFHEAPSASVEMGSK